MSSRGGADRELSAVLSDKALILGPTRVTASNPDQLLKAHLQAASPGGLGPQHVNLGGTEIRSRTGVALCGRMEAGGAAGHLSPPHGQRLEASQGRLGPHMAPPPRRHRTSPHLLPPWQASLGPQGSFPGRSNGSLSPSHLSIPGSSVKQKILTSCVRVCIARPSSPSSVTSGPYGLRQPVSSAGVGPVGHTRTA